MSWSQTRRSRPCRCSSGRSPTARYASPDGSYTASLLADPARTGAKVQEEAEEVVRAAREESDERVAEEAADLIYHLAVLMRGREMSSRRRRARARWPSRALSDRQAGRRPTLEQVRELAREHNLIPLSETFIDDCQTPVSAFLKLRELPFDSPEPAFLLESADQGRVGRYSFIGFRPRKILRWSLGDPGDPYALAAAEVARYRVAELPDLPPFAGGAVGVFAYDLVRTVEPLGEPNPDPIGVPDLALMLTDALVVFDHLKRTVTVIANVYADEDVDASYARALETIAEVRWRLAGPVPRPPHPSGDRAARRRSLNRTCRASASRPTSPGSSSTSSPATPSRSCPRSAGRRRSTCRRSRSTGACARSTRVRTCTSWTSGTSRSPAPVPSR